jgi:hypothetical protein
MPKKPSLLDRIGPMGMQPSAHGPTAASQMLPLMPCARVEKKDTKGKTRQRPELAAEQKKPPTRAEAVRAAWARITRLKSLRKQRDAQKG